jgi:hypothetical protein
LLRITSDSEKFFSDALLPSVFHGNSLENKKEGGCNMIRLAIGVGLLILAYLAWKEIRKLRAVNKAETQLEKLETEEKTLSIEKEVVNKRTKLEKKRAELEELEGKNKKDQ